jgi:hypothetical protein
VCKLDIRGHPKASVQRVDARSSVAVCMSGVSCMQGKGIARVHAKEKERR